MTRQERFEQFGQWAFELFWNDGEPGDVDQLDLQEKALKLGILTRRTAAQAGLSCADWCEWQPGQPLEDCECLFPVYSPRSTPPPQQPETVKLYCAKCEAPFDGRPGDDCCTRCAAALLRPKPSWRVR